jgi:hypothetical protein
MAVMVAAMVVVRSCFVPKKDVFQLFPNPQ